MTTTAQPDVIDRAFAVDLEALAAAEAVAAAIAAGESPKNIREVCRAADWGESRLKEEVERMRQVIISKKAIAAEGPALQEGPKAEAAVTAENLRYYRDLKKEHLARLQPLLQRAQDLRRVCDQATRPRQRLRDELLPRHIRDEIKAIAAQLSPLNGNRRRLEDEIHKLKIAIPEDVVLMASMTVQGAREKYREEIARQNEERSEIQRNRETQLKQVKQEMKVLLDREEQFRSTYVSAVAAPPAEQE